MKKKETQFWVPFYIDKWIFGSTRHELAPDERSVFVDLILLAGKDEGFIRANTTTPYPLSQLAGLLVISEELLARTIEKCLRPDINKLKLTPEKTLYLTNWSDFNYSQSHKRRLTRELEEKKEDIAPIIDDRLDVIGHRSPCPVLSYIDFSNKIKEAWNQFATFNGLASILTIVKGSTRDRLLRARYTDKEFDFDKILKATAGQSFLFGTAPGGWRISFDWIIRPTNYIKILEGQYRDSDKGKRTEAERALRVGENKPTTKEQQAEDAKLRPIYEAERDAFMKRKGYKTEDDIPFAEAVSFTEWKRQRRAATKKEK